MKKLIMEKINSKKQVISKYYPTPLYGVGIGLILFGVFIYFTDRTGKNELGLIGFLIAGVLFVIFFAPIETITIDQDEKLITIHEQWILEKKVRHFSFQDILMFEIGKMRSKDFFGRYSFTILYRIVMKMKNGKTVALQEAYSKEYKLRVQIVEELNELIRFGSSQYH